MTVIYLVLIIVLSLLFALAIQRQMKYYPALTPVTGWLAGLFYFIVLPLTLIILNQGYERPGYPQIAGMWGKITTNSNSFLQPFLMVWLTLALTYLTVIFFTPRRIARNKKTSQSIEKGMVSIFQLKKIILSSILISFIFWGINIFLLGGGLSSYFSQHWYYRFSEYSEQLGRIFTLYLKIYSANQIILTAATGLLVLAALKKQWNKNYGLLALAFLTLLLHMVMSGNRIYIALVLIYSLMGIYYYFGFKTLFKSSLILAPLGLIFSIWAYIRSNIANLPVALNNYLIIINQASSRIMTTLMDITEGSDSMMLIKVIQEFGNTYGFLYGQTYLRAVTWVLPGSSGLHVDSFSIVLAKIYQPGIPSSMSSTALGEMWANFGYFSIFLMPIFTFVLMSLGHYIQKHINKMVLLNSYLFVILIWMARSVFGDNFQILIVSILIIWGMRYEKNLYYLSEGNKIHPASSSGDERALPS
ncbi:MAG: hypothetical protein A2X25_03230 [Chloroflexi bacterium GWB2_49_20]|nr:MAG: hypothetical protein A2X25_03230 [Chloroflexi bacterium GWB2_49_20]OGN76111.1 MAG: hypothetical protein A2X26_11505 [Chloroflexi bacterium GWC2_49_37]OGN83497.1 MAG: hypothetical protein A2X27_09340 [Chloroflexi bacterium GWD2_49_16]HBG73897.1 hypothetical protein [Anaerolineae bacterium]HCC79524.1 hypothetical protein [Anaerolineae bacterium]